ncbi:MAG: hypothetical protein HC809_04025 [Gammaproteobacteria bacterium]|nr:hypothetical protein [Gammaproteobacteria bacterium]
MTALLIRIVFRVIAALPLARAQALGRVMGGIIVRLNTRAVAVTRTNIEKCLPQLSRAERERLITDSIRATGMLIAETGWSGIGRHIDGMP